MMKKFLDILAICIIIFILICGIVWLKFGYRIDTDGTYFIGDIDIFIANENDLKNVNLVKYDKAFGYVSDAGRAVRIATNVLNEIYDHCGKTETPFIVHYNENADTWIVHGSLPFFMAGGVGSIGIKKDTGEVIMITHSK